MACPQRPQYRYACSRHESTWRPSQASMPPRTRAHVRTPRVVIAAIWSFWDHIPVNVHTFIRRTLWLSTLTNLRNT